jgi:hypothetical protein
MRIYKRMAYLCALSIGATVAFAAPADAAEQAEQEPKEDGVSWDDKESMEIIETCSADVLGHPAQAGPALTPAQRAAMCQAAVTVAYTLGCTGIGVSCATGSVLTVGSVAIPCVLLTALHAEQALELQPLWQRIAQTW